VAVAQPYWPALPDQHDGEEVVKEFLAAVQDCMDDRQMFDHVYQDDGLDLRVRNSEAIDFIEGRVRVTLKLNMTLRDEDFPLFAIGLQQWIASSPFARVES
jgi:hypothetical protein